MAPRYRYPFLDQWLTVRSDRLRELVDVALAMIDHAEWHFGLRQRVRRAEDLKNHQALVETIIANLAYAVIAEKDTMALALVLGKGKRQTRYDRPIFRKLRRTLGSLTKAGVLRLDKSWQRGVASTIEPDPWFVRKVAEANIGFEDFARHEAEEVIVLARVKRGFKLDPETLVPAYGKQREWIDYTYDTRESRRYREEVHRINAFLAEADLALVSENRVLGTSPPKLKRYFNLRAGEPASSPRFDLGGRLFGGWWQNLEKSERRHIRIDGEPIVDLDYSAMFPRLAYLKAGAEPPEGDPYAVPGLEGHRDGVKEMMNTLFFADGSKHRLPSDIKPKLPENWTARHVKRAILSRHPGLESVFETGIGFELMFTESQILITALLSLNAEGITGLPMHDGIMVAGSKGKRAMTVMEEAAEEVTGCRLPVELEEAV